LKLFAGLLNKISIMPKILDILKELEVIQFIGNENTLIDRVIQSNVDNQDINAIMWVSPKNAIQLKEIKLGTIICAGIDIESINSNCNYIVVEQPRQAFQKTLKAFFVAKPNFTIAKSAIIHSSAVISADVFIGENVVIERGVKIGKFVQINHNTTILSDTIIGDEVIIGCNCTIGGVGFGYEKNEEGEFELIPHIGNVVLEDFVEIGNNTCIDRAVLGSTILRKNAKVDNLVHIAHGVEVGENSMVIANAMVAGSVKIGRNSWIAPSASILNQKKIGDNVTVGLAAVVVKDVADDLTVMGSPAENIKDFLRKKKQIEVLISDNQPKL
jgi:UDP-3-O-[3-hydroxymyristoyl] glucosamine N-acyltransferase